MRWKMCGLWCFDMFWFWYVLILICFVWFCSDYFYLDFLLFGSSLIFFCGCAIRWAQGNRPWWLQQHQEAWAAGLRSIHWFKRCKLTVGCHSVPKAPQSWLFYVVFDQVLSRLASMALGLWGSNMFKPCLFSVRRLRRWESLVTLGCQQGCEARRPTVEVVAVNWSWCVCLSVLGTLIVVPYDVPALCTRCIKRVVNFVLKCNDKLHDKLW